MPTADRYTVMEALHDFIVEYLEPAGVAENTRKAYSADIVGISRLVAPLVKEAPKEWGQEPQTRLSGERFIPLFALGTLEFCSYGAR